MAQIEWRGVGLEVRRIVLSETTPPSLAGTVRGLAERAAVGVVVEATVPQPGDLWVGSSPEAGWGGLSDRQAGWVRGVEIYLAIAQLRRAALDAGAVDRPVTRPAGRRTAPRLLRVDPVGSR
jgi:hypothetical protein